MPRKGVWSVGPKPVDLKSRNRKAEIFRQKAEIVETTFVISRFWDIRKETTSFLVPQELKCYPVHS